jgi:hypothetical protein
MKSLIAIVELVIITIAAGYFGVIVITSSAPGWVRYFAGIALIMVAVASFLGACEVITEKNLRE